MSAAGFHVGAKAVCIVSAKRDWAARRLDARFPAHGEVVTVRAVNVHPDKTLLRFEEYDNRHLIGSFGFEGYREIEPGFDANFFEPVSDALAARDQIP